MNPRTRAAARFALLKVNTPFARRRMRAASRDAARPARLELGGLRVRTGWLVTNVNALARLYLDATHAWPFENASLSRVYADNMIEHVSLDAGRAVLAEAYRCLQPGGVIRLVTPDIRAHIEIYLTGVAATSHPSALEYGAYDYPVIHAIDMVRIPVAEFGHHVGYVYDFDALAAELTAAGFHSPRQHPVNESSYADLADMEVRGSHGLAQMAVEAVR